MKYEYRFSWMLEGRIIFVEMKGDLAAAPVEYMQAFDSEINQLLDQGSAPLVHSIGDMRMVSSMPDFRVMSRVFTFPKNPHMGWQLMVGMEMNPAVRVISHITSQIFRVRNRQMNTVDEAVAFLQKVDSTLPDLSHHASL